MKSWFGRSMSGVLLAALLMGVAACTRTAAPIDGRRLSVVVSIAPQQYLVERIGGPYVDVSVMVPAGADAHTFEPRPEQMRLVSRAAAYFSIGVEFESAWLPKIVEANRGMVLVDTVAGIEKMPLVAHDDHGAEGEGEHELEKGAPDPHVWLSPELVKVQSQAIFQALAQLDPAHKDAYQANLDGFIADINQLESDIRAALSGLKSPRFLVFHPAWGYFARDFGLEQIPVEVGGQEPSAQELAHLISKAREEGIQVVFAQPEFSTQAAETIAREIGGEVLLISPLAPDWLANMRAVATAFADAMNR